VASSPSNVQAAVGPIETDRNAVRVMVCEANGGHTFKPFNTLVYIPARCSRCHYVPSYS
jgi:hypothetical protein